MDLTKTNLKSRVSAIVLAVCLLLMAVTSAVGRSIQTSGGSVRTQEVEFTTDVGAVSHAKLYIPSDRKSVV